ncbi:hypothetical protein F5Y18DRAFT_412987 [Xylariaceae sp. FL1019]|nr:hypothetical protein F5Y18DRAFT_412987 [Xylariaceae sp. FL1019]
MTLPIIVAEPLPWATCVRQNATAIAVDSACAQRELLRSYLMSPGVPFESLPVLEWCLISAGCTDTEAAAKARQIVQDCESHQADELRRQEKEIIPSMTTMPIRRAAESLSPTTSPASLSIPSACSTLHSFATKVCAHTTINGQVSDLPCSTTTIATLECAATNVCMNDGSCRFRHDELTPSGVAVTILLSLVAGLTFAIFMVFYIRERLAKRKDRRDEVLGDVMLKQRAAMAENRDQNSYSDSDDNPFPGSRGD